MSEMESRTDYQYNKDMCQSINLELDRLGWSSETAPDGNTCLDAFPTTEAGIIVIEDMQATTAFDSEGLLRALYACAAPITYADLWHAMRPHVIQEED